MGKSRRGHSSGTTVRTGSTSELLSTNSGVHLPPLEARPPTLASNHIIAEEPAKLTESGYDKVVMWTGGSYDCDDVMRALVRLDRPEIRPGTRGQNDKTVPKNFTDPEVDAPTPAPCSQVWIQPSIDRPHWDEVLDALQEDIDFCEDGAIAIPGVFYITDDGQETTMKESDVPQILLHARPAFRHPGYRAVREELNAAQLARGFFDPRRGVGGREHGPRMKRSSILQLKLRTRCARCRRIGHWARESRDGNRGQRNDERYDRRAGNLEDGLKGFIAVAGPTGRRPFFLGATWTFVAIDPGEDLWDTGAGNSS